MGVHAVPSSSEVINEGEDGVIIKASNGRIIERHKCHHSMNQTEIREKLGLTVNGDGWQVYTKMDAGDSVSAFLGNWKVPTTPQRNGQILYTFTGLQNIDWVPPEKHPDEPFDIIQPVMQYGRTPAGGGNYWGVASWYVTIKAGALYTKVIAAEPGDIIFGNMTKTGSETWFINSVDLRTKEDAPLTVSKSILKTQPWAYVTLEVYDVESCEQYPPSGTEMPYTNLTLFESGRKTKFEWKVGTNGQSPPICGATIKVLDAQDVTITF